MAGFFGGVLPDGHKALTSEKAIETLPAPAQVIIPMSMDSGNPCEPVVNAGDTVTVGQKIGKPSGMGLPVHASVSGTVAAVEPRLHSDGGMVMSVVIDNDFRDTPCPGILPSADPESLTAEELTAIIREAGIADLSGSALPADGESCSAPDRVDTVIVNAAESEPYVTSADRILRETPERVICGLQILLKVFGVNQGCIGIGADKKDAVSILRENCPKNVEIRVLKSRYPLGAEKQLIQAVTGRQMPPGASSASVGCRVFGTADCAAVFDAVYRGTPLIRRVVTVSGSAVTTPKNLLVPVGTPYSDLIAATDGFAADPCKILAGGPMAGVAQTDLCVPVLRDTDAVTCLSRKDCPEVRNPHCIRCGRCADVCPMRLMPLFLYRAERESDVDALAAGHVGDCTECGSCAYICPARVPLVQSIRNAKAIVRAAAEEKS